MKGVLITGATGSVGSRIFCEYLLNTDYRIFAIVRGKSKDDSTERLRSVADFWDVSAEVFETQVVVLCGDICSENLGLKNEELRQLKNEVQIVVHAAANIRLNLSLENARKFHLNATRNLLHLANTFENFERFSFMSTLEVLGDYTGLVKEEYMRNYQRGFLNTYEQAKSETENFLEDQLEKGAPIITFRVGMLVGEESSGKAYSFQSFYMMLETMLLDPSAPILPRGNPPDTIPVDILAKAVVVLSEAEDSIGRVYHLFQGNEDRVEFEDLIRLTKPLIEEETGTPLKLPVFIKPHVHYYLLKFLSLITFGKIKKKLRIQLIFLIFLFYRWSPETKQTRASLAKHNIHWPKFEEYLPRLIKYYFENRSKNNLPF